MQDFLTFITPVIQNILYLIIIAAVGLLSKQVIKYLESKRESLNTSSDIEVFTNTLDDALKIVQDVVDTVSQTYVNSLKAEGKFDSESQKTAFNTALDTAKKLISASAQKLLEDAYGDLDSWLTVQIESYILSKKS
jgi:hypothetical protein